MKKLRKGILALLLSAALCANLLGGCGAPQASQNVSPETENLMKLCKVWGYVKYTHPAFLLGKLDWDEELLELIPKVQAAETAEEVNTLLHAWFQDLGEVDYGTTARVTRWATAKAENVIVQADTGWTADAAYLGEALAGDLAQLAETPAVDRSEAPVQSSMSPSLAWERAINYFANEPEHEAAYDDTGFRLLGLFRLWNAMEYYFPYLELLDRDWEEALAEYIPLMLEGTDQDSYERVLAFMAFETHDPHVMIMDDNGYYHHKQLGEWYFPAPLKAAEGKLVVSDNIEGCPLEMGDVLVAFNGVSVEERLEECKQYTCYSREDAALNRLRYILTLSKEQSNEVTVLRDGQELTVTVESCLTDLRTLTATYDFPESRWNPQNPYELLKGNIGLINPALASSEQIIQAMTEFRDTDGLIVDLRQYPGFPDEFFLLFHYLVPAYTPALVRALPSVAVPGTYVKEAQNFGRYRAATLYSYEKPVILLMDNEGTQSAAESAILSLSIGENVVSMGINSAGGNGQLVFLPLPGGQDVTFSSYGVYTVDGELTQRTGITPDIYVEPTVQGVAEGRDELMEAAIAYLQNAA